MNPFSKIQTEALIACAFVAAIAGGVMYVQHIQHAAQAAHVEAATQADVATVATGQTAATTDAFVIADRGAQRSARTAALHEDHAHAILSAAGSSVPVDPSVVAAVRRGLCDYDAYAGDPGCAELRGGDPAQLPPAS